MKTNVRLGVLAGAIILSGLTLTQCQSGNDAAIVTDSTTIESIREGGELVVLTLEGPTTYTRFGSDAEGYEIDIIDAFAESIGVKPRYVVMKDVDALVTAIERGRGHIGAAGLTITDRRAERIKYGPAYKNTEESVVCHQKGPAPVNFDELTDVNLTVLAGSSYVETLQHLNEDYSGLQWATRRAGSAMPMLQAVALRRVECTVADSHLAEYARRLYPDLIIPKNISEDRPLGWIYNEKIAGMDQMLEGWFMEAHASGYLEELDERWFGHLDEFDYVEVLRFVERVDQRLPEFRTYFEAAAESTEFDWHLLAAQAYQESHWDPDAKSPTGVRGLMMLTLATARELGIDDRTDP
ncbi:MAG: transporter substrate-binding domain-containing protein, partial [Henriciella sp.]